MSMAGEPSYGEEKAPLAFRKRWMTVSWVVALLTWLAMAIFTIKTGVADALPISLGAGFGIVAVLLVNGERFANRASLQRQVVLAVREWAERKIDEKKKRDVK
jgi:hypothetical protein